MNDVQKYQGVIPAFYACYDETGEISPERVRTLTRHLAEKGVKAFMSAARRASASTKASASGRRFWKT